MAYLIVFSESAKDTDDRYGKKHHSTRFGRSVPTICTALDGILACE